MNGSFLAVIMRKPQGKGFPFYEVAVVPTNRKRVFLRGHWWTVMHRA